MKSHAPLTPAPDPVAVRCAGDPRSGSGPRGRKPREVKPRAELPPFAWLRAFDAAGRRGSFKEAAKELHVSPSSISHQVRDLEKFLGTPLFVRRTRAVELTPLGKRYLEQVCAGLDTLATATDDARGRQREEPLRIGMLPFTASEVFVPTLNRLCRLLPDLEFEVESRIHLSALRSDAAQGRLDAVIRYGDGRFEGLKGIQLTPVWVDVVCSPQWARDRRLERPHDVAGARLVVLKDEFQGWRLWGQAHGVDLPGDSETMAFDNYAAGLRAVEQGLGLGLGLLPLVQPWIEDGRLARPLRAPVAVPQSMYLVFAPGGARESQLEALGQQLRGYFDDLETTDG